MKTTDDEALTLRRRTELARRLAAATTSHWMGLAGVDSTLRRMAEVEPGKYWMILAQLVERDGRSPLDAVPDERDKAQLRLV